MRSCASTRNNKRSAIGSDSTHWRTGSLLGDDTVRQTLDKARCADLALVGVGDMSEDSNMVRMGWFSADILVGR